MNISEIKGCLDNSKRVEQCLVLQTFGKEELLLMKELMAPPSASSFYRTYDADNEFYIAFIDRLMESKPAEPAPDDERELMHTALYRHIVERICNPATLVMDRYVFENISEDVCDYSLTAVCGTAELLCRMGEMGMDVELYSYFDWDKTVQAEFRKRIAGTSYAGMQLNRIYANVVKGLIPEKFRYLIPKEQTPSVSKAEILESMCNRNSKLAAMIERLKME